MSNQTNSKPSSSSPPTKHTIYEACHSPTGTAQVLTYLQKGGCLTEGDALQMTLLHHAAYGGNLEVVEAIFTVLATSQNNNNSYNNLMDAQEVGGWTALHYAVNQGHLGVVERLLQEGANVNVRDANQRTPLHLASLRGDVAVVKSLLEHGAMKGCKNVAAMTPKDCACLAGHTEVEALL